MIKQIFLLSIITALLCACATSPTGRKQLLLMSSAQMSQMGATAFNQMQSQRPVAKNSAQIDYVLCVTNAITQVLPPNQQYRWEVNVFQDNSANAFALPGGKIGVHTGLLKVATNQDQLAAVIGHEVGHVLANHSNERMSIQHATQTGTQLLHAMSGEPTQEKQQLFALLGLGTQYGIALPFSRTHESEADVIGLNLMAKAGFNPNESVTLWQNMAKASGGRAPMEFLSTHPSNQTRINGLKSQMANANKLYQSAIQSGKRPNC